MLLWVIKHRRDAEAPMPGTLFLPLDKIKRYSEPPIGVISFFFPFWGCEEFRHLLFLDFLPIWSRGRAEAEQKRGVIHYYLTLFIESAALKGSEICHRVSLSKLHEEMVSFAVRALLGPCVLRLFFIFYHWNCC